MTASAFNRFALLRALRAGDATRFKVDLKNNKDDELARAGLLARDPKALTNFTKIKLGKADAAFYDDYASTLIMRSLSANIRYRAKIRISTRQAIVKNALQSFSDSTPMFIHRRDIEKFYDNIPIQPIIDGLLSTSILSPLASNVLAKYLEIHCAGKMNGLPRGISLSAILAEYVMKGFDRDVKEHPAVHKYLRFADDILIFSYESGWDVDAFLTQKLPIGLKLNTSAEKRGDVSLPDDKTATGYESVEYLGYSFNISKKVDRKDRSPRSISVTIATKKLKKLRTRIILSLKSFRKSGDLGLLLDRIQFLTSNFAVRRTGLNVKGQKTTIKSGIYFNYMQCRNGPEGEGLPKFEVGLKELDGFLQSLLFGSGSQFASAVAAKASVAQVAKLRKLSFLRGYQEPIMIRFKASRIAAIKAAWAYV